MGLESGSPVFTLPHSGALAAGVPERCIADAHVVSARLEGDLRVTECSSRLGPLIWCQASIAAPALQAAVILRNRPRRADRALDEAIRLVDLVGTRERTTPRPAHPLRGLPGRSSASVRLVDQEGWTVAEEREIGECVDGILDVRMEFVVGLESIVWFAARGWSERGVRIGVSSEVVVPRGVVMRIALRPAGSDRNTIGERVMELPVIRPGMAWYTPERIIEGDSPEHAWVSMQFIEGEGRKLGGEHLVGHCVLVQPGHSALGGRGA